MTVGQRLDVGGWQLAVGNQQQTLDIEQLEDSFKVVNTCYQTLLAKGRQLSHMITY